MEFSAGQRWISNTEAQLGLGIVTEVSGRLVHVSFPAADEERTYAADSAPLSRVIYNPGDRVTTHDEEALTVCDLTEQDGIITYTARDASGLQRPVSELQLSCFVQLTTPEQRLLCGQFELNAGYELRVDTLYLVHELQQSGIRGLLGSRTALLEHQVYIANEVARRYAPRVLLADEVGLGKTIEAGMILHQQLFTGRASRVLLVVPTNLQYQWLVEMLRRFNLRFALFDAQRLASLLANEAENPFETEQLVICSLDLLTQLGGATSLARAAGWDLLVVDEAHHLAWSEHRSSPEYDAIATLATASRGLLLLTATPEQIGVEGHFARLRLLDQARFHDLRSFLQEEAGYQRLNQLLEAITADSGKVPDWAREQLRQLLGDDVPALAEGPNADRSALVRHLLDRHGTGRVMFRNTRAAIGNFPRRVLHPAPLPLPDLYRKPREDDAEHLLHPELHHPESAWLDVDPRVPWLRDLLRQLRPAKVLVICASARTAIALEHYLHLRAGVRSASFHEGLSIIERDSAAAYFADRDGGAQTLICSEIGSEGRNFQFAQHLVLFDLPLNPDLLEQRIGRLDRIGQRGDIHLHVPYLADSAQEVLFHWYDAGLSLFTESCAAGFAIFERFCGRLCAQMRAPDDDLSRLLADTAETTRETRTRLQAGRDRLLEMNSNDPSRARQLIDEIRALEAPTRLATYLERLFEHFGVEHEYHSEHCWVLRPGEAEAFEYFPALDEEGMTVTLDRERALEREDMAFLSWEHPLVHEAMDALLHGEYGNATLATIGIKGLAPGTLLMEAVFTVNCIAPRYMQLDKYLPLSPIRVLVDRQGKDLGDVLGYRQLCERCQPLKKKTAQAVVKQVRNHIEAMLLHCNNIANARLGPLLAESRAALEQSVGHEIDRLQALRRANPNIRDEEIAHLRHVLAEGIAHIHHASMQLQAVRLVVNT